jgi:hypothetical protein
VGVVRAIASDMGGVAGNEQAEEAKTAAVALGPPEAETLALAGAEDLVV